MIKTILVGLGDVPYTEAATRYALELADRHEARLTAVTLVDPDRLAPGAVPLGGGESAKEWYEYRMQMTREVVERSIDHFESRCRDAGRKFRVVREEGNPFERLISCSRYHDLMICGLKNLFDHGVIDEPPYELIKLVEEGVRPIIAVTPQHREIRRVLIAYSGSPESAKTMRRFVSLNLWPDVEYHVITFDKDANAAKERLEAAQWYCEAHGFTPVTCHLTGSPKTGVLQYAHEHDMDLIVMGNSAKQFLLRRIFGETVLNTVSQTDRCVFLYQ
jgi:nucleotide-binding universal stress UspA family protein